MPTYVDDYAALLSGYSWSGEEGTPTVLTYSFHEIAPSYLVDSGLSQQFVDSFVAFNAAQEALVRQALAEFAGASGLTFIEVDASQGDITFGNYDFSEDVRFPVHEYVAGPGRGVSPSGSWDEPTGGEVILDEEDRDHTTYGRILHGIGHAIGIDDPSYGDVRLNPEYDNGTYTVMSSIFGSFSGLGLFDIDAIQHLYGTATFTASTTGGLTRYDIDEEAFTTTQVWGDADSEILGSSLHDDVTAGAGDDIVGGFAGNDRLSGGEGADTLFGGAGADTLDGGIGNDFADGGLGGDLLLGAGGFDTMNGGDGADTLLGGNHTDSLMGDAGDDLIEGGDGYDQLHGGDGDDTLNGGEVADRLYGDAGNDVLRGGTNFGFAVDGLFGGSGNDTLYGEAGFDYLDGGTGDDLLDGGNQADNLFGGAGNDTLLGGQGLDRLFGGDGEDHASGGEGNDGLFGQQGNDTLYGNDGNDRFFGGVGNDVIDGGSDDATVYGGAGFDVVLGGTGDDLLYGGYNADTFVFIDANGNDTIADFSATNGFEQIDLSGVSSLSSLGELLTAGGAALQIGADVLIDTGGGNSILLQSVNIDDLDNSDFIF